MKLLKITSSLVILLLALNTNAQEMANQKGMMNATLTHTFGYEKDGVRRPYTVTVRERRVSNTKFDEKDLGKVNLDRKPTPNKVAMLIGIKNPNNPSDNRVISLRYDTKINDTFNIEPTPEGFIINVNERKMRYIIGEGLSYTNALDKNHLFIDEFDMVE